MWLGYVGIAVGLGGCCLSPGLVVYGLKMVTVRLEQVYKYTLLLLLLLPVLGRPITNR